MREVREGLKNFPAPSEAGGTGVPPVFPVSHRLEACAPCLNRTEDYLW